MTGEMDFGAGRLLISERSLDKQSDDLLALVADVARGEATKPKARGN